MPDELSNYDEEMEEEEDAVEQLEEEEELADAEQLLDLEAEGDETPFDETRLEYSGVEADGEGDVDVEELSEAGALLDDPERISLLSDGMDDPDGIEPSEDERE